MGTDFWPPLYIMTINNKEPSGYVMLAATCGIIKKRLFGSTAGLNKTEIASYNMIIATSIVLIRI